MLTERRKENHPGLVQHCIAKKVEGRNTMKFMKFVNYRSLISLSNANPSIFGITLTKAATILFV